MIIKRLNLLALLLFLFFSYGLYNLNSESIQTKKGQEALEHEVAVTLKLVQVYVMDKKGNPVTDLEKSDFEVFEDGNAKEITEFEKHILTLPSIKKKFQEKSSEIIPPKEKMTRKFFLFFDFAFNNVTGLKKSKEAALHFINTKLLPSDEVGILSYSTLKGLILHEYLTTEHQKVREVVGGFGAREILGRAENMEGAKWREATGIDSSDASKSAQSLDGSFAKQTGIPKFDFSSKFSPYKYEISRFSLKVKELAKALRYIPGQKHIILFSSGVVSSVLYGIGAPFGSIKAGSLGDKTIRDRYESMINELASSNCSVYTLNSEELRSTIYKDEDMQGVHSLKRLAKVTGGKYYDNAANYEDIMEEIQSLTSSYYVLGYYIDEKKDGKYHEIKVKVKRKGCQVHTQGGYYNPKPFSEYTKLEKQIHLVDLALTEKPHFQDPIHFPLLTLACSTQSKSNLALISKIPEKTFQRVSDTRVEIVSLVFDEKYNIIGFNRQELDLSKLPKKDIYYYTLLSQAPGIFNCRVVLRNMETGIGAVASSSVIMPERPDSGLKILPPLLLIQERSAVNLNASKDIFPFDFTQYSPLIGALPIVTTKFFALVKCSIIDIPQPDINLSIQLIHQQTNTIVPLTYSVLNKYKLNETDVSFIEIILGERLVPGEYFFHIRADDINTNASSQLNTVLIAK